MKIFTRPSTVHIPRSIIILTVRKCCSIKTLALFSQQRNISEETKFYTRKENCLIFRRFLKVVCPSARPHETNRLLNGRIFFKFDT
jgi:hypothetical protein